MNANELADAMDTHGFRYHHVKKAVAMLRQQSDLIDLLRMGQPNIDYDKELLKPMFVGRELTDEEILILAQYNGIRASEILDEYVIDFARAILRKAQEADKIESLGTVNIGGVHFRNGKEVK